MSTIKRTPLCEQHEKLGGRMVEFAGWRMPIQFEGVKQEHMNVRENVGLFDVSHMGEIFVRGEKALETLQYLTTNDVSKLENGQAQYTLFPNSEGGIVDDLIVYCLQKEKEYLLCVNAANIEKDYQYLVDNNLGADISNESDEWAQVAVQGPKAISLIKKVFPEFNTDLKSFNFVDDEFTAYKVKIARTGYTGEDGVEIFIAKEGAESLWSALLEQGDEFMVKPIGLGARDTLRTEVKFPLYGHEINDETNPYSAGLGWVVKPSAKDFLGKAKMLAEKEAGIRRKLVAFNLEDRGIPREDYKLFSEDDKEIGFVTSGTMSPCLNIGIGVGYVDIEHSDIGSSVFVDIRGRKVPAKVVKAPYAKK